MTYISGTITNGNPAATLYSAVDTALASAGFTLSDTVTISARTHKVWKSPAASNVANKDWYLDVAYTTAGAGTIAFTPFEDYDAANDLAFRGPFGDVVAGITPDATYYSKSGSTGYALENNTHFQPNGSGTGNSVTATTLPTTAFGYWLSITPNRVIALYSSEPTKIQYTGLYTPSAMQTAHGSSSLFPLFAGKFDGPSMNSNYSGGLTRWPKIITPVNPYMSLTTAPATMAGPLPSLPSGITTGAGGFFASSITIQTQGGFGPQAIWGNLIDLRLMPTDATVTRADTVSIGADTWILTQRTGAYSLLFKAV